MVVFVEALFLHEAHQAVTGLAVHQAIPQGVTGQKVRQAIPQGIIGLAVHQAIPQGITGLEVFQVTTIQEHHREISVPMALLKVTEVVALLDFIKQKELRKTPERNMLLIIINKVESNRPLIFVVT